MADAAIGFRHHTGWAVAVTLTLGDDGPVVLDRRHVDMVDDDRDAYHAAAERSASVEIGTALIARIEGEARTGAAAAIAEVMTDLATSGHTVVAAGVPAGRSLPPLASILRSHPLLHSAEGELYREALARGAEGWGLRVTEAPVKALLGHAARALGADEAAVTTTLTAVGKSLGPPWQRDHRDAALLAWLALTPR